MFSQITKHLRSIEDKLTKRNSKENPVDAVLKYKGEKEEEEEETPIFNETAVPQYDEFKQSSYEQSTPKQKRAFSDNAVEPHGSKLLIIHEVKSEEENEEKISLNISKDKLNKTVPVILQRTYGQEITDDSFQDYLSQYDPLPRSYIKAMLSDENNEFDHKYGVRHNPKTEKFILEIPS